MKLKPAEQLKYQVIREHVGGKISRKRASVKLAVTMKTISVMKAGYLAYGKSFFSHKLKGYTPVNKVLDEIEDNIVKCYKERYNNFNFSHFYELIESSGELFRLAFGKSDASGESAVYDGSDISDKPDGVLSKRTVTRILERNGIISPQANRKRRRDNIHLARPRRLAFGELVQLDASIHDWLSLNTEGLSNGREFNIALHLAIDDSGSSILGAHFAEQETLAGYFEVFRQILVSYGILDTFYTDRRTVFEHKAKLRVDDEQIHFKRACQELGVEIISTSVAQAKGRVERSFKTHQDRLVNELRLAGITTIDEANTYLPEYIKRHNKRFALKPPSSTGNASSSTGNVTCPETVFRPLDDSMDINYILSIRKRRRTLNGGIISYMGKQYFPVDDAGSRVTLPVDTPVEMVQTLDQQLLVRYKNSYYKAQFFNDGRFTAHTPPPTHPWRRNYGQKLNRK